MNDGYMILTWEGETDDTDELGIAKNEIGDNLIFESTENANHYGSERINSNWKVVPMIRIDESIFDEEDDEVE